jgi:hypothetical protein
MADAISDRIHDNRSGQRDACSASAYEEANKPAESRERIAARLHASLGSRPLALITRLRQNITNCFTAQIR